MHSEKMILKLYSTDETVRFLRTPIYEYNRLQVDNPIDIPEQSGVIAIDLTRGDINLFIEILNRLVLPIYVSVLEDEKIARFVENRPEVSKEAFKKELEQKGHAVRVRARRKFWSCYEEIFTGKKYSNENSMHKVFMAFLCVSLNVEQFEGYIQNFCANFMTPKPLWNLNEEEFLSIRKVALNFYLRSIQNSIKQ